MNLALKYQGGRRNLICVLDWGIGHASRSLALAKQLVEGGELVDFAAAGNALAMLQREWNTSAVFHHLPAYDIDYRSSNMVINIGRQLPGIIHTIYQEHRQVNRIQKEGNYDRIISDSRFGCYHASIPSVMLSHQLYPIFGLPLVGAFYRSFLKRNFTDFWVPDYTSPNKLSGQLSDTDSFKSVQHIGPLSRLKPNEDTVEKIYDYGCLLSGPEPQRSHLETCLVEQLQHISGHHWIVAGLPNSNQRKIIFETSSVKIERIGFSPAKLTALLLRQSKKVICRSGYSTLMDLDQLDITNVLLVPTPGQTEQIYLAKHWAKMGRAEWMKQSDLHLQALNS